MFTQGTNYQYVSSGRSPSADQIYNEYLETYQYINEKINVINQQIHDLPPGSDEQRNQLLQEIQQLVALQGNGAPGLDSLYQAYIAGYTDQIPLSDWEALRQKIMQEADTIAGGGSDISSEIKQDFDQATQIVNDIESKISQDQDSIQQLANEIANWEKTIQDLSGQAAGNPQAQKDLQDAIEKLAALKQQYTNLSQEMSSLQSSLAQAQQSLHALNDLINNPSPTESDKQQADELLANVQTIQSSVATVQNQFNATLPSNQQIDAMNAAIQAVQNDLNPYGKDIQADYQKAVEMMAAMQAKLVQDKVRMQQLSDQIASWENTIEGLQEKVAGNPKAQADLQDAVAMLAKIKQQSVELGQDLNAIQSDLDQSQQSLNALTQLFNLSTPSESDKEQADALLANIQAVNGTFALDQAAFDAAMPSDADIQAMVAQIQAVNNDIQPTPPSAPPVENGAWYLDWTSWGDPSFPIPQGVNTINIFVGEITIKDGKPTMDGFGTFNPAKLAAFVQACHAQGISVKVSIGGSGGQYDRCWDQLTSDNVQSFAQGMADFCHQYGLDGVDFDYEEFASAQQETLVGNLIRDFKEIDPKFQTSLCSNAGFSTWQGAVKNILDGAMDASGNCAVDRLYIMSYYDPLNNEEAWIMQWASWLKDNYHFAPSQITVGLDDTDAHAYDITQFAEWAKEQGFSTSYWAWNPATPDSSNQSTETIWNVYHNSANSSLFASSVMPSSMMEEASLLTLDANYYADISHSHKKHLHKV